MDPVNLDKYEMHNLRSILLGRLTRPRMMAGTNANRRENAWRWGSKATKVDTRIVLASVWSLNLASHSSKEGGVFVPCGARVGDGGQKKGSAVVLLAMG